MKNLIYSPQPNATPDEAMQVMKVILATAMHPQHAYTKSYFWEEYEKLPLEAKRHFKIVESK